MTKSEEYLNECLDEIEQEINEYNQQIIEAEKARKDFSEDFSEEYYGMDNEERVKNGELLGELEESVNLLEKTLKRLYKQLFSPFFGSFVFEENSNINEFYVGINNLVKNSVPMVCDWRAPVCSVYYDYEIGKAKYEAPCGTICGQVLAKKQYKIENSILKREVDTSTTLSDNILIEALDENSSDKMKNIVSTIQKEQNKIIRVDNNKNIIVQGVAGSGKTSIALHKVAYLLYKNKNTLKSEDILIISPNKIFSDYISNVLPELGEENIAQADYATLAESEIKHFVKKVETKQSMMDDIISGNNVRLNEIAYKNSFDFYESLKLFLNEYFKLNFVPKDIKVGKNQVVLATEILELYNKTYQNKTPSTRIDWICDYIVDKFDLPADNLDLLNRIKTQLFGFYSQNDLLEIYCEFLESVGMKFEFNKDGILKFEDIPAVWYIKNYFISGCKDSTVKYLIIDEMQDYSYIVYDILNEKYDCKKILLGDINQCVEKILNEEDLKKLQTMLDAELFNLTKTYRSTYEINEFTKNIKKIKFENIERHGLAPTVTKCENLSEKVSKILELIKNTKYKYVAILCKTSKECESLHKQLNDEKIKLICEQGEELANVMIMPIALSKGLEFDQVVAVGFDCLDKSFLNKNLSYIASTRALHKLDFVM